MDTWNPRKPETFFVLYRSHSAACSVPPFRVVEQKAQGGARERRIPHTTTGKTMSRMYLRESRHKFACV